jgi:hypothetical protein
VEKELPIKDDIILKLDSSWKAPIVTLNIKTLLRIESEDKKGRKRTKYVPLRKAFAEIWKFDQQIKKLTALSELIQRVEKYADRSRLKPEEKREVMFITKQWREFGLDPRINLTGEQAKKKIGIVEARKLEIESRRDQLKDLQSWATQIGDAGAIEFRVYSQVDGVPLDLVRSTGWQD